MRGITEIVYVHQGLGNTPAATNRKTGVVYINIAKWEELSEEHRLFILLHELGHIALDTSSEFLADKFAFEKYTQLGYSLTDSVYALSKVLTLTSDEHFERIEAQLMRALNYDASINNNDKAENILNQLQMGEELDNFRGKRKANPTKNKAVKKVGRFIKKAAVVLPPVAAVRGARAIKKAVVKKRIAKTPSKVYSTPETALMDDDQGDTRFEDGITTRAKAIPTRKPKPTPAPMDVEEEEVEEEIENEETEPTEESEESELDNFKGKGKKFLKKVGDGLAPIADMALKRVPGGNALVDIRKGFVKNAKDKTAAKETPTTVESPQQTGGFSNMPKAGSNENKGKNNTVIIAVVVAVILVILALVAFFVFKKK